MTVMIGMQDKGEVCIAGIDGIQGRILFLQKILRARMWYYQYIKRKARALRLFQK